MAAPRAIGIEVAVSTINLILLLGGLGLAVLLSRLMNPPPQLQITDRGILDRRLALGWLDWQSIDGAYRPRRPEGDRLLLRVRVDERLGRRLRRAQPAGRPIPLQLDLSLDLSGTGYSEVEVLQEIMARSQAAAAEARPRLGTDPGHLPCA